MQRGRSRTEGGARQRDFNQRPHTLDWTTGNDGRTDFDTKGSETNVTSSPKTSGLVFGETLHFITDLKLRELEKQRVAFAAHAKVLEDVKTMTDPIQKAEILVKAIRDWSGSGSVKGQAQQIIGGKIDLGQLDIWIAQSKKDPCFSPAILEGWVRTLQSHIEHNATRFEYAQLFGNLLNEWISSGDSLTGFGDESVESPEVAASQAFVNVGRKEMLEQKERLQSLIFEPSDIDVPSLNTYLEDLFPSTTGKETLKAVRSQIKQHSYDFQHKHITSGNIRWTIASALNSDLMSEGKRATIRQMASNSIVMDELASVLNMRLADLEAWSWPEEGVEVDMRRALNGKYRAFTDPDIIDGLFLEYIGISWQIQFKTAFGKIFRSRAWKPSLPFIPRSTLQQRREFIIFGSEDFTTSLEAYRAENRRSHFFMSQLADHAKFGRKQYDEGDAEKSGLDSLPAIQIKQRLIHTLMTDCHLNTALHKSHTVVRSDFEWFGPSLPHETILAVLEFFGVPNVWLQFFKAFLTAPTRFKGDPSGSVRTRRRGTPINYAISQLLGEVVLFVLDFAVNQHADGLYLYRLHDDIWFWDPLPERCEKAWEAINKFTSLTGLSLNEEKTGAACVGGTLSSKLPKGEVRWGFLKFDAEKTRFIIVQDDVQTHIKELQRQLAFAKSIFGWVNVYNKYMAFFRRNFGGRPPACFGQAHIDDTIDSFAYIQKELFPNHPGGAVGYLRSLISSRMGVENIPEGYFYFPITLGGLELRNPMIEAFALRRSDGDHIPKELQDPDDLLDPTQKFLKEMENDRSNYNEYEARWRVGCFDDGVYKGGNTLEEFMSFEEYVRYREQLLENWLDLYKKMLLVPAPQKTTIPPVLQAFFAESSDYHGDWVVALYGEGLVEKFGSLKLVDASLIPVGMVDLFKTSKLKWDQ